MLKHVKITDISGDSVYLERWSIVIPFLQWTVKFHRISRADDDRCHHSHPWWFLRFIVWGGYEETCGSDHRKVNRRWLSISYCPKDFQHRITKLHKSESWSLVLTGKHHGEWGFFTKLGYMHWRKFVDAARSSKVLWCSDGTKRKD